jgi:asparagine synthase (glutamine-hydrolysing)
LIVCGICGLIGSPVYSTGHVLNDMAAQLEHRGPDDAGSWCSQTACGDGIGLANTRLAILDLSAAGHQPMVTTDGDLVIAYNGEVYNFHKLRCELRAAGHTFRTGTDTEVLLHGYRQWGIGLLKRLRGMFAFGLWHNSQQTLLLARDRLGIKPLYYWRDHHQLLWASEVRALVASGLVPRRLSLRGLNGYLALGAVQDPDTLVDGVHSLPAGHYAVWRDRQFRVEPYWCPPAPASAGLSAAEAAHRVRELLADSVRLHRIADVPVGVFLSGGLDSSALVAFMAQDSSTPLHTVSITFPGSHLSEASASHLVATHFHTEHTEIALTVDSMLSLLPDALCAMDQPTFDGINSYVVAKYVREAGLKVAVSGLGGDELFGGYPSFRRYPLLRYATALSPSMLRRAVAPLAVSLPAAHDIQTRLAGFMAGAYDPDPFPVLRTLFSPLDRKALAPLAARTELPTAELLADEAATMRGVRRTSWWELNYYMKNVLLRDTDAMTMAHGLEARVPFLDHQLVEFVLGLPSDLVLPPFNRIVKPLLARACAGLVPDVILGRRKMGFTFPLETWLRAELRPEVEVTLLQAPCSPLDDVLERSAVAATWHRYLSGKGSWHRPWALFVLKKWVQTRLQPGAVG